ncbi:MAG: hypothetical protein R2818_03905 [Flavobacteriales bacterium]
MTQPIHFPALALVLITAILTVECTVVDPPKRFGCRPAPEQSFDPMRNPQDTTARKPFLDPQALFADDVYVVRPIAADVERTALEKGNDAAFVGGQQALVSYLKEKVLQHIAPGIGWLKPPIVHFTMDAQGAPTQVELVATSGNEGLDMALVRMFKEMPHWEPATDAQGQALAQAFEFTVGPGGC